MGIKGAIISDIIGSQYEFSSWKPKDFNWKECDLFGEECEYTDDTVLSIATKYAIDSGVSYEDAYAMFAAEYPNKGYGDMFEKWFLSDDKKPYNSFGNGSAMRVSYIGEHYSRLSDVLTEAERSAKCTHNHEEGIKGATVIAVCVWMAKNEGDKDEILKYANLMYPKHDYIFSSEHTLDELRDSYYWSDTCQSTVPVAIRCFYESTDFESCMRNCFSLDCDMDTVCCIAGAIAESYYGTTGLNDEEILHEYLDCALIDILNK